MTYAGIERKRFAQLLEWGADDDELRSFFSENRLQLIQKGAKVQNPPHGKAARVRMLAQGLPPATDRVVQNWFYEHLKMLDPKPVDELLEELRLYEEAGESPSEDEAKQLARSCLVHLFSNDPPAELMSFLRPTQVGSAIEPFETKEEPFPVVNRQGTDAVSVPLCRAVVALAEGRDPDEFLSSLPAATAAFIAGVQAVRSDRYGDAKIAMEALDAHQEVRSLLSEYLNRRGSARSSGSVGGLQMLNFLPPTESFVFDFDRDEVFAVCTRDFPETTVFLHPIAIRAIDGTWFDLSNNAFREELFHSSGDLIAFPPGRDAPRQPKRGEVGIWRVAENKGSHTGHRTNFHITSEKTSVFEVRDVPFDSSNYDAVREYIKHAVGERGTAPKSLLFLLRDQLIVGCPVGKDLTRDEGFESGLPCWRTLLAFRFEGRMLVPGPLPPNETYECEALGSSLRKLFASGSWGTDKPTKALVKKLQELIASGEPELNSERATRLRSELSHIDQHEGAMAALLDEVMRDPFISTRIDAQVNARVEALVAQKDQLSTSIKQLESKHRDLLEKQRTAEKEQRAIAPTVSKSIRVAFDKAREDVLGTLGQVVVFKALMDELIDRPAAPLHVGVAPSAPSIAKVEPRTYSVRSPLGGLPLIFDTLRALGVAPKSARAIEAVGKIAHECGLMLIIDGLAGRIAAEAWLNGAEKSGKIFECGFGETDDHAVRALLVDVPEALAILDANMSPLDIYARPLVNAVLQRLAGIDGGRFTTRIVMSVADGTAALPLPAVVESLSLQVSLDRIPVFLQENEAEARLDDIETAEEPVEWFAKLWKPAKARVLSYLKLLPVEEKALVLAMLEVAQSGKSK